jgi:hypothetical protein
MNTELTLINGNGRPYTIGLPRLFILGKMNDGALEHVHENTGLQFVATNNGLEAQPENGNQIAALLLTFNFKTRYFNNASVHNTLFLKNDHHTGFDVDSICFECVKHNHIHAGGLKAGDRLAC